MSTWLFGYVSDPWSPYIAYILMVFCFAIGTAFGYVAARAGISWTWLGR